MVLQKFPVGKGGGQQALGPYGATTDYVNAQLNALIDQLNAQPSGDSGLVLLASGEITTPVATVDIALPGSYSAYKLEWYGLVFGAGNDGWAGAVSFDGGATWLNDYVYDPEGIGGGILTPSGSFPQAFSGVALGIQGFDYLMDFDAGSIYPPASVARSSGVFTIYPGDTNSFAHILSTICLSLLFLPGSYVGLYPLIISNNILTNGRINAIRFQAYGGGVTPPLTLTLNGGSYRLWGVN